MPKQRILQENQTYTFSSYFDMTYEPDEILGEFGYTLRRQKLALPETKAELTNLVNLRQRLENILPLVSLTSEIARREILVAPILMEVAAYCHCQLRIEYVLNVNSWLRGSLDYLLISQQDLLVVEANKDDLIRGFTQLAVQLIALAEVEEQEQFYGAVTIGNAWSFGKLNSKEKVIDQDITLYSVPNDLEKIVKILVAIVEN